MSNNSQLKTFEPLEVEQIRNHKIVKELIRRLAEDIDIDVNAVFSKERDVNEAEPLRQQIIARKDNLAFILKAFDKMKKKERT